MKHSDAVAIRWFKCDQCSLQTKYKRCLNRHMTKHEVVRIYSRNNEACESSGMNVDI
ncbi:hypothetical protein BDFB_014821, partial [Asbolus verrucosus]